MHVCLHVYHVRVHIPLGPFNVLFIVLHDIVVSSYRGKRMGDKPIPGGKRRRVSKHREDNVLLQSPACVMLENNAWIQGRGWTLSEFSSCVYFLGDSTDLTRDQELSIQLVVLA